MLAGAVVAQGELEAVITETGADTFFGKTIALLGQREEPGHLQQARGVRSCTAVPSASVGLRRLLQPGRCCQKPHPGRRPLTQLACVSAAMLHLSTTPTIGPSAAATPQVLGRVGAFLGLVAAVGVLGIFIAILCFGWGAGLAVQLSFVILASTIPIGMPVGAWLGWLRLCSLPACLPACLLPPLRSLLAMPPSAAALLLAIPGAAVRAALPSTCRHPPLRCQPSLCLQVVTAAVSGLAGRPWLYCPWHG